MLTVHHLENSRSQRILWLLEELGVDYRLKRYARDPETRLAPPELIAVHPLGKAPVITDAGHTVAESGAIIEYVLDRYGNGALRPEQGTAEFEQYRYWMHFAEGTFMPLMLTSLIFRRVETARMPFFARPVARSIASKVRGNYIEPNTKRVLDFTESRLDTCRWFAGDDLTAADVQMSFPIELAAVRAGLGNDHPRLRHFLDTIHARPAYKAAIDKGGPFELQG